MPLLIAPPLVTNVVVLAHPQEEALRVFPLEPRMVIGRLGYGGQNDPGPIQLFDGAASSGRHARFVTEGRGAQVVDLGSSNTTMVNGARIKEQALHLGDTVQVGRTLLRFEHTLNGGSWPSGAQPLFEAVLAVPHDDAPRRVLADFLTEHGDPRGEFIACQLSAERDDQARALELLARHELEWAAPLPIPVESWTFARGFLASVRVRDVAAAQHLRRFHPLTAIEPLTWERWEWQNGGGLVRQPAVAP